jgi:UDP-N-acetylglucosamine 4-epimerase
MPFHFADSSYSWLITGAAGFIGSHLVENLLQNGQCVVGFDNFVTGKHANLEQVKTAVTPAQWTNFHFIEGDITNLVACQQACARMDYVLHHAALGSVPQSIQEPLATHSSNVTGFANILLSARDAGVKRVVYASSSAVYGDDVTQHKVEDRLGRLLSPYAMSKLMDEMYADVFARVYGIQTIGLRYFNVFGPRQDPLGAYAAVIPRWISAMIRQEAVPIFGNGETTRDFCYVKNVVQANILAATTSKTEAINQIYNVAVDNSTSLNELFTILKSSLQEKFSHVRALQPKYGAFREGDILHSRADISKIKNLLGYEPRFDIHSGLRESIAWYQDNL